MNDRRRINGPAGGTTPPVYITSSSESSALQRPSRTRKPNQLRRTFLQTGLTPSASGSAYLEVEPSTSNQQPSSITSQSPSLKLACTVHGPRPLPRSAPFSPQLLLSAHVKFTPFASRQRRGYIRDSTERDLSAHLESALKGVIIGDRWPKSGVDVTVTVLEGQDNGGSAQGPTAGAQSRSGVMGGWESMTVLAGCITVGSAALTEAGIDCVDLVTGGFACLVVDERGRVNGENKSRLDENFTHLVLDPCPSEHDEIIAGCVVGYLASKDEIIELWLKGDALDSTQVLIDQAMNAANGSRGVLEEVLKENIDFRSSGDALNPSSTQSKLKGEGNVKDVEMSG